MGRTSGLWLLLPQEALPLLLIVGAFLVMFRMVSRRRVLGAMICFVLLPLFSPIIEVLFDALPVWVSLLFLMGMVFWCFRAIATTVLGRGAAEHMMGSLAADIVRFLVKAACLPIRLVWRILWR